MAVSKYSASDDDLDYMDFAVKSDEKTSSGIPWYKSYPAAAVRGLTEGIIGFNEMFGGSGNPEEASKARETRKALYDKYLPIKDENENKNPDPNPYSPSSAFGLLGTLIQSQPESFVPQTIERTAKIAPYVGVGGAGPLETLVRSGAAGLSGQTAQELGMGDTGQSLAELPALLTPNFSRKIPPSNNPQQNQLADFSRRMGLAEGDIALTSGQRGFVRDFAEDVSSKGGRTVEAFDNTRRALGRVWDTLRGSPQAQQPLTGQQSSQLINALSHRLSKLPAESRNRIQGDFHDLLGSQMTGSDIINFWQDLNYYIPKGERGLGILKEDLQRSLNQISPQLGHDFRLTNQLYGNFSSLAERMGPSIADSLISAGENGILITAISTGNYPLLQKVLGPIGARILSREMIINPRLQNLSSRFINAFERGSPAVAKKVYDQMVIEVGKSSAEAAMKMSGFDMDSFFESLDNEENSENKD